MDSTEYRDLRVTEVRAETVTLHKLSNMQDIEVPLRATREITPSVNDQPVVMTLRVSFDGRKISSGGGFPLNNWSRTPRKLGADFR